jgi:hypothetical protein
MPPMTPGSLAFWEGDAVGVGARGTDISLGVDSTTTMTCAYRADYTAEFPVFALVTAAWTVSNGYWNDMTDARNESLLLLSLLPLWLLCENIHYLLLMLLLLLLVMLLPGCCCYNEGWLVGEALWGGYPNGCPVGCPVEPVATVYWVLQLTTKYHMAHHMTRYSWISATDKQQQN